MGCRYIRTLFLALILALVAGAAFAQKAAPPQTPSPAADDAYRLGSGDKVHIAVFGQPDLNGDFAVDGGGSVQLPLIGTVKAAGLTVAEFQKQVISKYADGYLVNPNVEVDVVSYRPFYIIGEVRTPGQYQYVNGMSALNAVAWGVYGPGRQKRGLYPPEWLL